MSPRLTIFAKDAVLYGIGNVGARVGSFLLIPLFTHYLSVKDYGLLSTLTVTIEILFIIMHMGLRTALLRFAKEYEEKGLMGHLIGTSIIMNGVAGLVLTGLCIGLFQSCFSGILHAQGVFGYIVLSSCSALSYSIFILLINYYRAKNCATKYMLGCVTSAFFLVGVNSITLLIFNLGVKGVLIAQILTYSAACLYVLFRVLPKTGFTISVFVAKKLFCFGFPLIFAMSGSLVMQASSFYFLSHFNQLEDVAIYALGCKIAAIADIILISSFQIAYEPFVFSNVTNPRIRESIARLFTYLMFSFTIVAFGIILLSRDLLTVIAPQEYSPAFLIIILVIPSIAFRGVYYTGETLLNVGLKTHIIGATVSTFAILSVFSNYILIQAIGMYGAVITANLIGISRSTLIMIMGLRTFPLQLELRRLAITAVLFSLFLALFLLLKDTDILIFYVINLMAVCVSLGLLFRGGFYGNEEREFIRSFLTKIKFESV